MLHSHHQHLLFPNLPVPLSLTHHQFSSPSHPSPSPLLHFLHKPTTLHTVSAIPPATSPWAWAWLTHLPQLTTATEDGPIQLPFSTPSIIAATDDPSSIQVTSTVLLTGTITVFLFCSLRRRAKRAKELKFRSSGVKSLGSLKAMGSTSIKAKSPPSPDQALLGAVIAGIIAVILFKFTTSIDAALSRRTVSDNFSVRQITITIRTIINGLCYLATFVYGFSSIGLLLYSGELALNTFVKGSTGKGTGSKITDQSGLSNSSVESLTNNNKLGSTNEDQSSNNS